jgi:outer membrane immunogenic protein
LVAAIAAFGFVSAASAADMPVKAPVMVAPVYNWTGLYLGINGGYAWGSTNHTDLTGLTSNNFNTNGGLFGVTYGANWQFGKWVLGFEGDFDFASINGTFTSATLCSVSGGTTCFTNLKNFGTERIRAGYDMNGWLLYATGGLGFGEVNAGQNPCGPAIITGLPSCGDKWRTGWVAGAGVEKMFAPHWSAKLEYLHYDLGNSGQYNPGTLVNVLERGDMVRFGINYNFGHL